MLITMIGTVAALYFYSTYGKDIPIVQSSLKGFARIAVWFILASGAKGIYNSFKREKISNKSAKKDQVLIS